MLLPLVTADWQNRYHMDSQIYIKFVVDGPFFTYTKFEYFDRFIDKERVDMAMLNLSRTQGRYRR